MTEKMTEDELNKCKFNIEEIECVPQELFEQDMQLLEIQERINDVKGQLDYVLNIPQLINHTEKNISSIEKKIRNYNTGLIKFQKYKKDKLVEAEKELESLIYRRKDCSHYSVMNFFYKLPDLSLIEKLKISHNVIERFKDTEHVETLDLNIVSNNIDDNKLRCYKCNQSLICKHYLFGINLLNKYDEENVEEIENEIKNVYGVLNNGSYYCKICGDFICNTAVQDTDEFAKGGGGPEGARVRTREVVEDINIIEKQKIAIENIMNDAIYNKDGSEDDDLKFKIRIYNLLKQLSGIQMLSVNDEINMMNYLKNNKFVPIKSFKVKLLIQLRGKKVNQRIIDKLAEENYLKYMTCDIIARYLITLQTSKNIYHVKNNLTNGNYIGWPLIQSDTSDLDGINMMIVFINQMSLNDTYKYLLSGSAGLPGLKKLLMDRITEMINNDVYIKNLLELSLTKKFENIEFMIQQKNSITNTWVNYRPPLIKSDLTWTPTKELSNDVINNWSGKIVNNIFSYSMQNINFYSQKIINNITNRIKNEKPTRGYLGSIGNTCLPINMSVIKNIKVTSEDDTLNSVLEKKIDELKEIESKKKISKIEKISKSINFNEFINTKINFYSSFTDNQNINSNFNQINKYNEIMKSIRLIISNRRYNIIHTSFLQRTKINLSLEMNDDELKKFFLMYVDSGINKGNLHLFDNFGRCLLSNQLKEEVSSLTYNQSDFEKLLKYVNKKNKLISNEIVENKNIVIDNTKYNSSKLVIKLMNSLESLRNDNLSIINNKNKKMIDRIENHIINAIYMKLITELEYSLKFSDEFDNITNDIILVNKLMTQLNKLSIQVKEKISKKSNVLDYLYLCFNKTLLISFNLLHDSFAKYLNVLLLPKNERINISKEKFNVLSNLDHQIQLNTSQLSETLSENKKEKLKLENIIVEIGNLENINVDYKHFIEKQYKIIPSIDIENIDIKAENYKYKSKAYFVSKIFKDLKVLISMLKNGAWESYLTSSQIGYNYREFFKFKENKDFFNKFDNITQIIYSMLQIVNDSMGKQTIIYEYMGNLNHYLLLLNLNLFLDIILAKFDTKRLIKTLDYISYKESVNSNNANNSNDSEVSNYDNENINDNMENDGSNENGSDVNGNKKVTSDNELDFNFGKIINSRKESLSKKKREELGEKFKEKLGEELEEKRKINTEDYPELKESNDLDDIELETNVDDGNIKNSELSEGNNIELKDPTDSNNIEDLKDINEYVIVDGDNTSGSFSTNDELDKDKIDDIDSNTNIISADNIVKQSIYNDRDSDFDYKIIETKNSNKELIISFIKCFIDYISTTQETYNEMNEKRIQEQIAKEKDKQVRLNLETFEFLAKEGMEDDYKIIRDKMAIGELQYKDLNAYTDEMFGDELIRDEDDIDNRINNVDTQEYYSGNDLSYDRENVNDQAHKNRFGLDNGEMEEMNAFVGDPDEHDMEEQDYGYYMAEGD